MRWHRVTNALTRKYILCVGFFLSVVWFIFY
ncbi:hypothetical protein SPV_2570 [Streptococcus pneumoniae]|nr:hypothetical protein SPV_2570 [Streptococcus pneumoniae]